MQVSMDIKEELVDIIYNAVSSLDISINREDILVEVPKNIQNGDYSTNVAMRFCGLYNSNPMDFGEKILSNIDISKEKYLEKVEIVRPGFINFYLSNEYYLDFVKSFSLTRNNEEAGNDSKQLTEIIEYTDPNPFKVLHIGHLYTNIVGESFAKLRESLGINVKRAIYQGDVGLHVAKTLWALNILLKRDGKTFEDIEKLSLEKRVEYLGEAYIYGSEQYDDHAEEINNLNYYIFTLYIPSLPKKDFSVYEKLNIEKEYLEGRKWCLDYFEEIYKELGTKFDYYFLESEICDDALKIVNDHIGTVFEKDGVPVIYKGDEKKHLHTRVFINSYGEPTYEAKELALAHRKNSVADFDRSIIITADEQSEYFRVVLDALSKINPSLAEKTTHIAHGMIKLPGAEKMTSRKGKIISAQWLIDTTKQKVKDIMVSSGKAPVEDIDYVSGKIALGAIKYAFLKVSVGNDISFDFDTNIRFDGDTGPYLMYVYTRCKSLLRENGVEIINAGQIDNNVLSGILTNDITKDLVVCLSDYDDAMLKAATHYSPSMLCQYLFDLGQKFSAFYQNVRVSDAREDEKLALLYIVFMTMQTMQDGLSYLGIDVVDHM